jgi:hypothetical protein
MTTRPTNLGYIMHWPYTTNQPWIYYALAMLSIFLITATVFFLYNNSVVHRQKLVLNTAEKSSTLVSALIPKTVRDHVLQEAHEKTKKGTKSNISFLARDRQGNLDLGLPLEEGHPAPPIIGMLLTRLDFAGGFPTPNICPCLTYLSPFPSAMKPLLAADFFPDVTIMFCDIRGFTSWARYANCVSSPGLFLSLADPAMLSLSCLIL